MSIEGVKIFSNVLSVMQENRHLLLQMGTECYVGVPTKSSKQDILLGQLLDKAKDAVKDEFCKITMEKIWVALNGINCQ